MTSLYFVRHAQPDEGWADDRTRPLTDLGRRDAAGAVVQTLQDRPIRAVYASPYRRSVDTVAPLAARLGLPVRTDERLREREPGDCTHGGDLLRRRWADFDFCEPGGEPLGSVQRRNLAALADLLAAHPAGEIVVGTHGTALSTILHSFDATFGCEGFLRLYTWMPYIVRLDFENGRLASTEDLLALDRGY